MAEVKKPGPGVKSVGCAFFSTHRVGTGHRAQGGGVDLFARLRAVLELFGPDAVGREPSGIGDPAERLCSSVLDSPVLDADRLRARSSSLGATGMLAKASLS